MIRPALQCNTLAGWFPVEVQSGSNPDVNYVVHVNPWGRSERHICECPGFTYRGTCRHQKEAHKSICGWNEVTGPEVASEDDRAAKRCPRCQNSASWAMWEDDEQAG